jgi:hypothetical protein
VTARLKFGCARVIRMPIMVMTIRISIRVKPRAADEALRSE